MRFQYDSSKNRAVKRKHGFGLKDAQQYWPSLPGDRENDDPEQFRAIGWCCGLLCSVIFEVRHDEDGEYYHLVTAWKATQQEEQAYAENV